MGLCPSNLDTTGTPRLIQNQCLVMPLLTPQYFKYEVCQWPIVDGISVVFNTNTYPYIVPYDFKSKFYRPSELRASLDTSCKDLNGKFPGCSTTDGCNWDYQTIGRQDGNVWRDCGIPRTDLDFLGFCDGARCCYYDASYCYRTDFDETYKNACINKTLETDFGLSKSVWINDAFWLHTSTSITSVSDGKVNFAGSSQSFNPYQIYCDPTWCATSPAADAVHFLECENSQTVIGGATRHAALAPTGICRDWYLASTAGQFDFQFGLHNWGLIDTMIEQYCKNTPYSVDSYSCNCVGGQPDRLVLPNSNYFTSCSAIGIGTDCPAGVAPVRAALSQTGAPQLISNPLCANITCRNAITIQDTFATRNIHQSFVPCPQNSCYLTILGTTFTANNIENTSVYVGNVSQFCENRSVSATAPQFTVQDFPTVWFWSNARQTVTNPAQVARARLTNISSASNDMQYSVSYDALPFWLTYQGAPLEGTLSPGNLVEFTLVQNATSAPLSGSFGFTFSALNGAQTFSSQVLQLDVAVISIDKAQPVAPPAGDDTNPNDIPLIVSKKLSPGAIALILLAVMFIIMSLTLFLQGTYIQNTAFMNMKPV